MCGWLSTRHDNQPGWAQATRATRGRQTRRGERREGELRRRTGGDPNGLIDSSSIVTALLPPLLPPPHPPSASSWNAGKLGARERPDFPNWLGPRSFASTLEEFHILPVVGGRVRALYQNLSLIIDSSQPTPSPSPSAS